jgi:hypothetical protein
MTDVVSLEKLMNILKSNDSTITNEEWIRSLDIRKMKELEFHDQCRDRGVVEHLEPDKYLGKINLVF